MKRALRVLAWIVAVLVAIPVVVVATILLAANTNPGRRLIEREAASLTGGTVTLQGLSGRFPDRLRLAHAELRDADGVWVSLDRLALDWSPLRLLSRDAFIDRLDVDALNLARLPAPAPARPDQPAKSGSFSLPVRVDVQALHVLRLTLAKPVAGVAAVAEITGAAHLASLSEGDGSVAVTRIDSPGTYKASGRIAPDSLQATIDAAEPPGGLASSVAHLPDLGALTLHASLDGPRTAEATVLSLRAGELRADAHGTLDLADRSADLEITATAPAMTPAPGVSWRSVSLQAHTRGPLAAPEATGHLDVAGVAAAGATLDRLLADVNGTLGHVALKASAAGLRIPGPKPELLAAAPLLLTAGVQLDDPARPATFALSHPLLDAAGTARTAGDLSAAVHLTLPELAPLAAAGGVDIQGHAALDATVSRPAASGTTTPPMRVGLDGTVAITGGLAPVPALVGDAGKLSVAAVLDGANVTLDHATVDGRALHLAANGTDRASVLDLDWSAALPELAALTAKLSGDLAAKGHVSGPLPGSAAATTAAPPAEAATPGAAPPATPPPPGLAVTATADGNVGAPGIPRGPVHLAVDAHGLPAAPDATLTATGRFDNAPVTLDLSARRQPDGTLHATLRRAEWKSAQATADVDLPPGATLPVGSVDLRMARLADLEPLLHQAVRGALTARIDMAPGSGLPGTAAPQARIDVQARDLALGTNGVARLSVTGRVENPAAAPSVALKLDAAGLQAGAITGAAQLDATGPQDALALRLATTLHNVAGGDATAQAQALLDLPAKTLLLRTLAANAKGEQLRLTAPAKLTFAPAVAVDRLRLALGDATVDVAGRLSPTLDLTAAVHNVTPALAKPFAPTLDAQGRIDLDARLAGTPAAPTGTVKLTAAGMRLRTGPAASLPPASLAATAQLAGGAARIDARLAAGPKVRLAVTGQAPLGAGPLALAARGTIDLSVADPILTAGGRRVLGQLALDTTVAGTAAAPRLAGTVRLDRGEVQDYAQGLHLTDVTALVEAAGDTLRLASLSARAGQGTITASGTVGVLAPGLPVDLRIRAANARPLSSDLLTAVLDADLYLRGQAKTRLDAGGTVTIRSASINVPSSLPVSVAKLDVIRPGDKPPAPSGPALLVGLDLTADAPGQIFVRGHGLDAELGGRLHVGGTSASPQISGGFDLRRGSFSLAGTTLRFSRGRVGFDGTGVNNKIDPTLDFEADTTAGNTTAMLHVGGYADAPKISLTSNPELPQDEVLARLLFGQSLKQLSPFQIAAIAGALADLSGVGGGVDPLSRVRKGLGLDRLSLGSAANGNGASVEAGRYVAQGVYVGAKQGTSGGTQAQVQIDLTRRLKLQTTIGTGGGTPATGITPDNDPGSSVGLKYQFEY
ncbi:MAG: translocation/assembly module TamB domain-containing protein [Janthinobacterium lividum]